MWLVNLITYEPSLGWLMLNVSQKWQLINRDRFALHERLKGEQWSALHEDPKSGQASALQESLKKWAGV